MPSPAKTRTTNCHSAAAPLLLGPCSPSIPRPRTHAPSHPRTLRRLRSAPGCLAWRRETSTAAHESLCRRVWQFNVMARALRNGNVANVLYGYYNDVLSARQSVMAMAMGMDCDWVDEVNKGVIREIGTASGPYAVAAMHRAIPEVASLAEFLGPERCGRG